MPNEARGTMRAEGAGRAVEGEWVECSLDDSCEMCTGEACELCGPWLATDVLLGKRSPCEHDVIDRHTRAAAARGAGE